MHITHYKLPKIRNTTNKYNGISKNRWYLNLNINDNMNVMTIDNTVLINTYPTIDISIVFKTEPIDQNDSDL